MLLTLHDFEAAARERLEPAIRDFFAGGSGDEQTVAENVEAFRRIHLLPRVLCGAAPPDLTVDLLGHPLAVPVIAAPTAFHRLVHPDGERATAAAVRTSGTIMIVSIAATEPIEEIAAAGARLWMQMYLQPDRSFTEMIVRRAEAAGCEALVLTVDSPVFGRRERDIRNGFLDLPEGLSCPNMSDPDGSVRPIAFSTRISWADVAWLRSVTSLKLVLKGVMRPDDARIGVEIGADAVIVSNHGGRQLDGVPASIALLRPVVEAVGDTLPVLVDGGIRRGTDILKAMALGATAVAIGRPIIWGLAVSGEDGVKAVFDLLSDELRHAAALCGLSRARSADPGLLCGAVG